MTRGPGGSRPPSSSTGQHRRRVPRVRARSSALAGIWSFIRTLIIIGIFGGAAYWGFRYFMQQTAETPDIGAAQINQLRPGMTPEQVHALLGAPRGTHQNPGTVREGQVDNVERARYFEYYRKGTLMLVYDANQRLIEVCIGETTEEYYDRKGGRRQALWQSYPDAGFIHQDVLRPGFQN